MSSVSPVISLPPVGDAGIRTTTPSCRVSGGVTSKTIPLAHAPDAGNEKELLPQHASDVARDLVRDAALLKCAGNLLDPFGPGPADLAEDDLAFAARTKDDTGADELERDVDRAGQHRSGAD